MCSSAPDTSGMNAAAVAQSNLSKEQLDWFKNIYNDSAPDRAQATANAQKVTDANLSMMDTQTAIAKDYNDYNKSTFRPLEKGIVADAQNYDTQDRREAEAGKAITDVSQNIDAAQTQQDMDLARAGVDPASGRALAIRSNIGLSGALGKTQAGANARRAVETTGFARRMDAASLGRGLPSAQATAAGLSLNAGSAGLNSSLTPLQVTSSGAGLMQTGFSGAMQGNSSAGNIYGNMAQIQNQADANGNAIWGGLGQMGGAAIMKYSDETMKEDIKPISGKAALSAIENVDSSTWKYKADSAANDGGKTHSGPMAQDMNRELGDGVAPGGKMINIAAESGVQHAAIKEIAKRMGRIEKKIGLAHAA